MKQGQFALKKFPLFYICSSKLGIEYSDQLPIIFIIFSLLFHYAYSFPYKFILIMEQLPQIINSRLDLSGKAFDSMVFYKLSPDSTLRVKRLVLFKCDLTANGLIQLSRLNWSNLVELNIWRNNLGTKGCRYISRASLSKLQTLDLGSNQIDSNGVKHLCKASFGNITEIDLRDNLLNMESVHWLLRLNQPNLTKIWIRKNRIPFDESLKFVLEERKITQLSVYDNDVEGQSLKQLGVALHQKFKDANIKI